MNRLPSLSTVVLAAIVGLTLAACGSSIQIDPPPGNPWFDETGGRVPGNVISVETGSEECGWEAVGFLELGWPPGVKKGVDDTRLYIKDPRDRVPQAALAAPYANATTLPVGAVWSGLETEAFQLWIASDSDSYVYAVAGPRVEGWPRAVAPLTCQTG